MKKQTSKEKVITDNIFYAHSNRNKVVSERRSREEFYHSDVDSNLTQFSDRQKEFIKNSYNIPISTKLCYPIIEQIISFLTGPKPTPRLVTSSDRTEEFTDTMTKAFSGVWYESKGNEEVRKAIQDCMVTGSGFLMNKKENFFEESTFNVIIKQVPWYTVLVDPQSREPDFRDAEFISVYEVMTRKKAEKLYDIKIPEGDAENFPSNLFLKMEKFEMYDYWAVPSSSGRDEISKKWVIVTEYFEKVENNVYISNGGVVSDKKPEPTQIPNPQVAEIQMELMSLQQLREELAQGTQESQQDQAEVENFDMLQGKAELDERDQASQELGQEQQQNQQKLAEVDQQIQKLSIALASIPKKIPAFIMIPVNKDEEDSKIIQDFRVIKTKQIKRYVLVNDKIVEEETLSTNRYPLHHIYMDHAGSPNKTYGMIHKIKDLVMATNKFWSAMLYDVMSNNNKKVMYPEGAISENSSIERNWNRPGGAFIEYIPDPTLPDGGRPTVVEPSPLNQAYPKILELLKELVEYITGINSIQRDQTGGHSGATGLTSLQNFGSQRVKLYARNIESALSDLAYTTICYLQMYAPTDKFLTYFDDNGDQSEIRLLEDFTDTQFKVRVDITNSLPTQRQAAIQLIAFITQTTQDPSMSKMLTELMLQYMDMPEGDTILEKINALEQMQQQLEQLQQQLQEKDSLNKSLENNMNQMKAAQQIDVEKEKARGDIKAEKAKQMAGMQGQEEQGNEEELTVPEMFKNREVI